MTKQEMKRLLKKHYKMQMEASALEHEILNEVRKHKPDSDLFCSLACIPYTEPYNFGEIVMEEIGEYLDD